VLPPHRRLRAARMVSSRGKDRETPATLPRPIAPKVREPGMPSAGSALYTSLSSSYTAE